MKIIFSYDGIKKEFTNKNSIIIGKDDDSDIYIEKLPDNVSIKLMYVEKFKNYVLINSTNSDDVLCNKAKFSKMFIPQKFTLTIKRNILINVEVENNIKKEAVNKIDETDNDIFNGDVEQARVKIIKTIGPKINGLRKSISNSRVFNIFSNIAICVLSMISSFAITNYMLSFKINGKSALLSFSTNMIVMFCIGAIIATVGLVSKQLICSYADKYSTRAKMSDVSYQLIFAVLGTFVMADLMLNVAYYKIITLSTATAIMISILFVGAYAAMCIIGGFSLNAMQENEHYLLETEYREDFESIMKKYRKLIAKHINSLSKNKLENIKNTLLNEQLSMILEVIVGIITAPFLAYGVSNTLAGCFPEAASWVRISGLRFSPVFLVLATFLIIFAFFCLVKSFTIEKQIKATETIKFDGFFDYHNHGVNILGIDSIKGHEKEKNITLIVACCIIGIEFTMNVSYFIAEIGSDLQGMLVSVISAFVPTALLFAETQLLSATMFKISNYQDLLSKLD